MIVKIEGIVMDKIEKNFEIVEGKKAVELHIFQKGEVELVKVLVPDAEGIELMDKVEITGRINITIRNAKTFIQLKASEVQKVNS